MIPSVTALVRRAGICGLCIAVTLGTSLTGVARAADPPLLGLYVGGSAGRWDFDAATRLHFPAKTRRASGVDFRSTWLPIQW